MIACILISRFSLRVASSDRLDRPVALAPQPGALQVVGETSSAAEVSGVHAGMRLGEALDRCPSLRLLPSDPARAAELWGALLVRLEGIGAAVESNHPGEAFFAVEGLRGIHGGEVAGVLEAAREAARLPVRIAAAPNRFAALLAACQGGSRLSRGLSGSSAEVIVSDRGLPKFLAPLSVSTLTKHLDASQSEANDLISTIERLGLGTLGALAALSPGQVADRFGQLGMSAHRLARGEDTLLRPRQPPEELLSEIELPEGIAGTQLDRALELLVHRFLAAPERGEKTVLALRLSALLDGGGSWSVEQVLGRPTASARIIGSLLASRLETLPQPAKTLRLRALALGPHACDQLELSLGGQEPRRRRLAAAVRETRAVAGAEALLKVIDADARSRVPERRLLLTPYLER